jgi:putative membrane protein
MKHRVLFAVSFAALALTACKKESPAPSDVATAPATDVVPGAIPGADVPLGTATQSPAQVFANTAAASDAFEIETSKLALAKGQSAAVKRFADSMIDAHTKSTAKLKGVAGKLSPSITPDAGLTEAQQQTVDSLGKLTGADFDKAYAKAQVDAHQATLTALKDYASKGDSEALKAFAKELVPTVTAHLNMAKSL